MKYLAIACGLGLMAASSALANQMLTMEVVERDGSRFTSCFLNHLSSGTMIFSKDVLRGDSVLKSSGSIDAPDERVKQFQAAVEAMTNGTFPLVAAEDEKLVPPYIHLVYQEGENGEIWSERRAVLPGTEIPPVMMALFEPLQDGVCVGP
jgi:hypothetical protein